MTRPRPGGGDGGDLTWVELLGLVILAGIMAYMFGDVVQ